MLLRPKWLLESPHHHGIILMIAACVFFTIMTSLARCVSERIPTTELVFFRSIVTAVVVLLVLLYQRQKILGNNPLYLTIRGGIGFLSITLNYYALPHIPLGDLSVLQQTSALWVSALSPLLSSEKRVPRREILTCMGFIGVCLILKPTGALGNIYGLSALGCGLCTGLAYLAIRKLHDSDNSLVIVFYFTAITAALSALIGWHNFLMPSRYELIVLLLSGGAGTIGQVLLTLSLKAASPTLVTPFSFSTVLLSFLAGAIFWGEYPDLLALLGTCLVVGSGVALVSSRDN